MVKARRLPRLIKEFDLSNNERITAAAKTITEAGDSPRHAGIGRVRELGMTLRYIQGDTAAKLNVIRAI